jgi:hypothetical protein
MHEARQKVVFSPVGRVGPCRLSQNAGFEDVVLEQLVEE